MIKSLKSQILASIRNKRINVFLFFLLSAFVILLFTKLSKEYTNTIPFEIEKLNVPQKYVILNDSVKLNITLKTHGFNWLNYYMSKPSIKIDFSKDVYKDGKVFVYSKSKAYLKNTQFDKNVELLNLEPEKLTFRFGVNLVKKVPIVSNTDIKFSLGYDKGTKVFSEPDSVVIVGPSSLVSNFEYLDTETLVLSDVRIDIEEYIKLKLPENKSDLKFSVESVVLKAKVEKFTEGTFKIPVSLINVPKGLNVKFFPKEVTVSYYVSLSNFKGVTPNDFKVICDFKKVSENQKFLKPELVETSDLVKNTKIDQKHIEFIITK
ncbi:CdaR family protein [uncultured Algibacter sp.]|uniref:CdaR family protein n=1 Tax=uncultured Algibacter sp. TaxID=298659 RepID=UPI00262F6C60|nr:CdaR family protein [uncultured Algibacter sp.]